jgi:PAS domain S-box-containing protein
MHGNVGWLECIMHIGSREMLKRELFEFLEETADAAFCVNQQGDICSWNEAAERLFGYSASDAIGKSCHGLLQCRGSLSTQICTREFYARLATAEHCRIPNFDLEVTVRLGHRIWVDLSTLVFKHGRTHPLLIVHLSRDITERKHSEDLLHKMLQLSKQVIAITDGNGIGHPGPVSSLSEQEKKVLRLFSEGKNSAEIARELGISLQTLRNHLHHVNDKLRTQNRLQAVMHAIHRKII